ncbi:MAG TPA: GNAT family N-acetyltransferase [Alloacidobacterium sp.]|nr:GNAT family N-acetyltransferase [Alloacidobacterium sp.]
MSANTSHSVSRSRFEFEENGETAWLEFETDSQGWITLLHTEVPSALRGRGIAGILAKTALDYARENNLKVDLICPAAYAYVQKHPEYQDLIGK